MKDNDTIITEKLSLVEELCNNFDYAKASNILSDIKEKTLIPKNLYHYHLFSAICAYEVNGLILAIKHLENCLAIIDKHQLPISKVSTYHELSLCYFKMFTETKEERTLQLSINYCQEEIRESIAQSHIVKSTGFMQYRVESTENIAKGLAHLGVLYQELGDIEKSNRILEIAKVCCKRHYDWKTIGVVYDELAANSVYTENINKALYYYSKALNAKAYCNNEDGLCITKNNINNCLLKFDTQYSSPCSNLDIINIRNISKDESL